MVRGEGVRAGVLETRGQSAGPAGGMAARNAGAFGSVQ